ncbi:MAG: GatB/YqeY domain-containing protein [Bacteroidetes bacterium]|nr:GatB/YqeY domain-containing protein [Bacteroidota bacterium]
MKLTEKVNNEITLAMKSRDEIKLRTFRNVKAAFLLLQSSGNEVSEDEYLKAVQKLAKQLKDSIEIFTKEGRNDLAKKENDELEIISSLLPKQLSEAEIIAKVQEIVNTTGFNTMKDLGKVMPLAMKATSGTADGRLVAEIVKKLLGQ